MSERTKTTDLIFEEPPPKGRGPGRSAGDSPIGEWLASLREHPGEWSRFPDSVHPNAVTYITEGRKYGVRFAGEFEATGRKVVGSVMKRVDLYARYIGEGGAS